MQWEIPTTIWRVDDLKSLWRVPLETCRPLFDAPCGSDMQKNQQHIANEFMLLYMRLDKVRVSDCSQRYDLPQVCACTPPMWPQTYPLAGEVQRDWSSVEMREVAEHSCAHREIYLQDALHFNLASADWKCCRKWIMTTGDANDSWTVTWFALTC